MYFSLITPRLGSEREAAEEWVKGPYEQHQWLWKFFPAEPTQRDFLFRRRDSKDKLPGFYLVSARKPIAISDAWQIDSREYDPQLSVGQRLAFELRVNPVVTHKIGEKSRRDDVVMNRKKQLLYEKGLQRWSDWKDEDSEKPLLYELVQETCVHWLDQRAERNGFALVVDEDDQKIIRADSYQQHRTLERNIRFSTVDFSGVLEVIDPKLFQQAIFNGIGRSKAFGCGLMLIRRA